MDNDTFVTIGDKTFLRLKNAISGKLHRFDKIIFCKPVHPNLDILLSNISYYFFIQRKWEENILTVIEKSNEKIVVTKFDEEKIERLAINSTINDNIRDDLYILLDTDEIAKIKLIIE